MSIELAEHSILKIFAHPIINMALWIIFKMTDDAISKGLIESLLLLEGFHSNPGTPFFARFVFDHRHQLPS